MQWKIVWRKQHFYPAELFKETQSKANMLLLLLFFL